MQVPRARRQARGRGDGQRRVRNHLWLVFPLPSQLRQCLSLRPPGQRLSRTRRSPPGCRSSAPTRPQCGRAHCTVVSTFCCPPAALLLPFCRPPPALLLCSICCAAVSPLHFHALATIRPRISSPLIAYCERRRGSAQPKRWHVGRLDRVGHLFGCAQGRKCIWATPRFMESIEGLSVEASRDLVSDCMQPGTDPAHVYIHKCKTSALWRHFVAADAFKTRVGGGTDAVGDVVAWDDRHCFQ